MMKDHPKIDWQALKKAKFIRGHNLQRHPLTSDFDAAVTAPVFGHATVVDYYNTASSTNNLPNIKTPTLILHALDDPIACMSGL
jgi:predicted alpha/beta-fold hydrolase